MELGAGPGVVQHQHVQLGLGKVGVTQSLLELLPRDEAEMAEVTGHVDNPGSVRQEGEEGIADVLEAPVVDIQATLDLAVVLGGVGGGIEVESSVVDQNVNLAVLTEDLVPESHHRDNVRHLHLFELNQTSLAGVNLLSGYKHLAVILN